MGWHEDRHRALALASLHGRTVIVERLLGAGEDPPVSTQRAFTAVRHRSTKPFVSATEKPYACSFRAARALISGILFTEVRRLAGPNIAAEPTWPAISARRSHKPDKASAFPRPVWRANPTTANAQPTCTRSLDGWLSHHHQDRDAIPPRPSKP